MSEPSRTPAEIAADLLIYAPVGLALGVVKVVPEWAEAGRARLQTPLMAARIVGRMAIEQQRRDLGERLRKATEPYFSPEAPSAAPNHVAAQEASEGSAAPSVEADTAVRPAVTAVDTEVAIPGYDSLSATQVLEHLGGLSVAELRSVRLYESARRRRKSVLDRVEQHLVDSSD